MWVGATLSRMELLTLHSFVDHGHEFQLWSYDDLSQLKLPQGVVLRDAAQIIPRRKVFAKAARDRETGVGQGSFGAPFSDLFRYKLLLELGGIWVDMDVTCLRPFDFPKEYAFRPHRLGVVGSVLKSPQGSPLLKAAYQETAASVDRHSDYLMPNRILSAHAKRLDLLGYVVKDMTNVDDWFRYILPMYEGPAAPSNAWYGIHWINEMWRTLKIDGGYYRGRKVLAQVPDKDRPPEGSTLWEMYRKYGLIGPSAASGANVGRLLRAQAAPVPQPPLQLPLPGATKAVVNMVIPSLVRGGAERIVAEVARSLAESGRASVHLFVLHRSRRQYDLRGAGDLHVQYGRDDLATVDNLRVMASAIWRTGTPRTFAHLLKAESLRVLWEAGITTIPVIHNAAPGWLDPPAAYDVPQVPWVVAVADAVAEQWRARGWRRPVVTLRHELQRAFVPQELAAQRQQLRDQFGLDSRTLLVGMIGQFKAQKAYTRAVQVLHALRRRTPAKLMILGAWDHALGGSSTAYEAMCRRAMDLGVIADVISVGNVGEVGPYLAAFDVYLNTSIYEGLSIALLEALQAGCPVVTVDAGGNREVLPPSACLLEQSAAPEEFVAAIEQVTELASRPVPEPFPDPFLVPALWGLLSEFMAERNEHTSGSGLLVIVPNLWSWPLISQAVRFAVALRRHVNVVVATLRDAIDDEHKSMLDGAHVQVILVPQGAVPEMAATLLTALRQFRLAAASYWGVRSDLRLLLTKILAPTDIRLFDVALPADDADVPDPTDTWQRRIAFTEAQYDARVVKLRLTTAAGRPNELAPAARMLPTFIPLPPPPYVAPADGARILRVAVVAESLSDAQLDLLGRLGAQVASRSRKLHLCVRLVRRPLAEPFSADVTWAGADCPVEPLLAQCEVLLALSGRGTDLNATLDALSLGLPVIAERQAPVARWIRDGEVGFVVSTEQELVARLSSLASQPRLRQRLSRRARSFAEAELAADRVALALYALLTGAHSPSAAREPRGGGRSRQVRRESSTRRRPASKGR